MCYQKADMNRKSSVSLSVQAIPAPGEGKRGPEGHLGYLLRQAHASVRGAMDRALAGLDLTAPQFTVLTMIAAYPGVSGADLARLTYLTPQTINVIVGNLERDGAIEKSAHATHGRILRLHPTARGHALLKRCRSRIMAIEAEIAGLLGKDEERIVRRWLSAVGEKLTESGR
jgi:DNA-binding MarR family transcriptional regulator